MMQNKVKASLFKGDKAGFEKYLRQLRIEKSVGKPELNEIIADTKEVLTFKRPASTTRRNPFEREYYVSSVEQRDSVLCANLAAISIRVDMDYPENPALIYEHGMHSSRDCLDLECLVHLNGGKRQELISPQNYYLGRILWRASERDGASGKMVTALFCSEQSLFNPPILAELSFKNKSCLTHISEDNTFNVV